MGKRIDEEIPGYGTPLHQAAFYGRANVVKLLLQNGADVATTDLDGDTPIKTTDMKWCSHKRNDRTCHMNPSDYRETVYLLTSGCKTIGCSGVMRCRNNRCVNLCDKIMCGINGVCSVHEERAVCRCNGDDYSGDPAIMCLKMGEAKYIFKAFCFVKDMITNIASAIVKDIKSVYYETKVPIKY
ncbi:unnamed protein product [Meganyctiphanes norvegica]|uniref:Uncharacterized protein n=1 Tax=Meganyctiphanes norvegica TaxID=48144 RepID=A0AAV2S3N0_MEGNR